MLRGKLCPAAPRGVGVARQGTQGDGEAGTGVVWARMGENGSGLTLADLDERARVDTETDSLGLFRTLWEG